MNHYDPSQIPDPGEWLALAESERIDSILAFHEEAGEDNRNGSEMMHAART